jgi:ATP phosphoribosyltransferase
VSDPTIRLALPSSGALHDPCMSFMRACGLSVSRANSRRYIAEVRSVPHVTVMFQRGSDITAKVDEGAASTGLHP